MPLLPETLLRPGRTLLGGAPEGLDARLIGELAAAGDGRMLVVARDDVRVSALAEALRFFAPDVRTLAFPAWKCLPYDRVSPGGEEMSRRIETLTALVGAAADGPRVVLTTVSAFVQRIPPRACWDSVATDLVPGDRIDRDAFAVLLARGGYVRAETVMEPGEYAVRGGIIDLFPAGREDPVRLDLFGDELESIRAYDPATQRSAERLDSVTVKPVSEVLLDPDSIARFRSGYRALFGASGTDDPLYAAISAGQRHPGMEHWLPLFHERLETVLDYLPDAAVVLDHGCEDLRDDRLTQIAEYYAARAAAVPTALAAGPYKPVPVEHLFLDAAEWDGRLEGRPVIQLSPFAVPDSAEGSVDAGGRPGADFADARRHAETSVFDAVGDRIRSHQREGRQVVVAAVTRGSCDRIAGLLADHGCPDTTPVADGRAMADVPLTGVGLAVFGLERGFVADGLALITEQDILGERLVRPQRRRVRAENFITEASALTPGDLVVHADHGIGRYEGLETIDVGGAPHDCLRIVYAGDDKLFLPVENIDMVSRYGSESEGIALDRLGGAAWQARKARMKKRVRDMAEGLIKVAAQRLLYDAPMLTPTPGTYEEFSARFPYTETDDQARAIDDVLGDLASGRPTDRLICGDVGFGKTEVALRAAFLAAMDGRQVAVVVPTTLLCRQHVQTFRERFAGYPVRVEQMSRLVVAKDVKAVKAGLADGTVDIVVGTHALLARDVRFRDLGLLIVDEEQHFGVAHKERLKALRSDVHVLTLTATPIPRTLQMALSGVREMSLIATPPVDRLAVRTFVLPFDPVVIREAILRERLRGGQTFYVCPRIEDLSGVAETLAALVPEVRVVSVHGRMAARDLEAAMSAFYDGAYDVLLSTNIIESGLDMPSVNTIVIHRADLFGLAQLYQLRGRVGRAKVRAYAYLTLPPRRRPTAAAERRLEVMQALDTLGAGFSLASHDLDIRGAGNLLGEEQSGHIREVGIELYQRMLEEAVAEAKGEGTAAGGDNEWSPQIAIGISVLIPESYVSDLGVRLGLYRRLADIGDRAEVDAFAAEMIDRFGPLPTEVANLLQVVAIKRLCRRAGVERVEAGPKGAAFAFRGNDFANPAGLVSFIGRMAGTAKLRPDHRLVIRRGWPDAGARLDGVRRFLDDLAAVAEA